VFYGFLPYLYTIGYEKVLCTHIKNKTKGIFFDTLIPQVNITMLLKNTRRIVFGSRFMYIIKSKQSKLIVKEKLNEEP